MLENHHHILTYKWASFGFCVEVLIFLMNFFFIKLGISKVLAAKKSHVFDFWGSKIFKKFLSVENCSKKKGEEKPLDHSGIL